MGNSALPQEIIDRICHFVAIDEIYSDSRYTLSLPTSEPDRQMKRNLGRLRLASKGMCDGASPHFFRHFNAGPTRDKLPTTKWRQTLLSFSRRPWIRHVRSLNIRFLGKFEDLAQFQGDGRKELLAAAAYAMPSFVRACVGLTILELRIEPRDIVSDSRGDRDWSRHVFLGMIYNVLQECLPTLEVLELALPLTCDFRALSQSIAKAPELLGLMSRLEGLYVAVTDSGGSSPRYGQSPQSDDHRDFPNWQHQVGFWRFIHHTTTLKALSIHCAHTLSFIPLPTTCTGDLQELELSRVEVPSSMLQSLSVELISERWADVLTSFCDVQCLITFHLESYNPQMIETQLWDEDYSALGAVQRHVNGVRAAKSLELYPDSEYRYMDMS
ncbi:hypothetical protein Q7P37_011506 [Cladosporium fusiforme]